MVTTLTSHLERARASIDPPSTAPPISMESQTATTAWFLALMALTTLQCFYDLDGGAGFEPTDCWVAQTSREMYEQGEWLVPRFSGETRLQKSPGAYWAVMAVAWARGGTVDEVAVRIPNALAALSIVAVVFWLTRRIAGDRAAIFAGFATASSTLILYWSHRGASDLGLTALITLSLACLWAASDDEPPGRRRNVLWLAGYFAAGMGMLYKMPMPLVCVGLPAFLYLVISRRWRVFLNPCHAIGLLLFFLPWLPWVIWITQVESTALAKWRVEFLDRFTGDLPNVEDQNDWRLSLLYLLPPLIYFFPYILSVPSAVVRSFRNQDGRKPGGRRFLLIWFLSLYIFFSVSVGKEVRYFLPALPPVFAMLGIELARFFDPYRAISPTRIRLGLWSVWLILPAVLGAGVAALHRWHQHELLFDWAAVWPPYVAAVTLLALGCMVSAWLFAKGKRNISFVVLVGAMWVFWPVVWSFLMPILVSQKPFIDFANQLRNRLNDEQRSHLYQVAQQDPRIIWYSNVRFPRVMDQLELLRLQGGRRSKELELRFVGERMIERLDGEEPALLVAVWSDFQHFIQAGPRFLEEQGRLMPTFHIWLYTGVGSLEHRFVVFGNRPPPWPEPRIPAPSDSPSPSETGTTQR